MPDWWPIDSEGWSGDMADPLLPHQEVGAAWLAERRQAFLADSMRVGKTPTSIRACDLVGAERILVLCPAVARMNWGREFVRFSQRERRPVVWLTQTPSPGWNGMSICSYDLAIRNSVRSKLSSVAWEVVILDEAHYLKSPSAQRTKAAYGLVKGARCWRLSGTPAPNHYGELYTHCRTSGCWTGTQAEFIDTFCVTRETPFGTQIVGNTNHEQLRRLLAPFLLRRRLEEVVKGLPMMSFESVVVEATPPDVHTWLPGVALGMESKETVQAKMGAELAAIEAVLNVMKDGPEAAESLSTLQGPKTTSARRWLGLSKVPAVVEIITNELKADEYRKIVLFAWHADVMKYLLIKLHQFNPVLLFGGTPAIKREAHLRRFQTNPRCQVFIGQIAAAGVAIDLSVAQEVAFVECSWVPGDNAQAAMRIHNLKQSLPVRCRFFSVADSLDERITQILKRKTKDLTALFDAPTPTVNVFE